MPLVNFVVVGPGKCGTTWLYGLMKAHREICASTVKETLFFEEHYDKGYGWYESFFDLDVTHKVAGEVSNTYISSPHVAERIHAYNKRMKIVVTVRNPIERALSHYIWHIRNGRTIGSFWDVIFRPEYGLLDRGMYYTKMQPYLRLFDDKHIRVQVFEDLRANQAEYAKGFLKFLGVGDQLPKVDTNKYRLEASVPRSRIAAKLLKAGAQVARRVGAHSLVQKVKESAVPAFIYRRLEDHERPRLSDAQRSELQDYFKEEVRALSRFLGRDLEALWFGSSVKH